MISIADKIQHILDGVPAQDFTERVIAEAYKRGFDDAIHVAEEWQDGKALTQAAIRTMAWRAKERMMGRDPYRRRNGVSEEANK